jgi:hypothetical protein
MRGAGGRLIVTACSLMTVLPADASAQKTLGAVRGAAAPPIIDGVIGEQEWQGAPVAEDFLQFEPRRGERSSFPTDALLLYDDRTLYIARLLTLIGASESDRCATPVCLASVVRCPLTGRSEVHGRPGTGLREPARGTYSPAGIIGVPGVCGLLRRRHHRDRTSSSSCSLAGPPISGSRFGSGFSPTCSQS